MSQRLLNKDAVAQWKSIWFINLKIEGSRKACAQVFFKKIAGTGGAENSAEISGTNGINFFAICTNLVYSLRHPVWVPEINITACNSVRYR